MWALRLRCGVRVNPHGFRHLAAKLYLNAHPGAYGVIKLLLGHKLMETTTNFYFSREGDAAFRRYDARVLSLRDRGAARFDRGRS